MSSDSRRSYVELVGVLAVGAGHVIIEVTLDVEVSRVYNAIASVGFVSYLAWRLSTSKGIHRDWGIRVDNLWSALQAQMIFSVPASAVILALGLIRGHVPVPPTFWLVCGLYPFFGVAQQFVLQNLLVRNLRGLTRSDVQCALMSSLLFSLSHLPRVLLCTVTLFGSFFFTIIYYRRPNIWAVGISHGLLGAMVFYMILGEDPGTRIQALYQQLAEAVF